MNSSTEWLPAVSKVNSQSYVWRIENFSESRSRPSRSQQDVNGWCSSVFKMSFVQYGKVRETDLCLLLTHNVIRGENGTINQWLQLSLSRPPGTGIPILDRTAYVRNYCTAWIYGRRKERLCMLTADLSQSNEFLFTAPEFVLYHDLLDKDKGLLCSDNLTIVCEIRVYTEDISCVNSWLFQPLKPVVADHMANTLGEDLKQLLDTRDGSDVVLVANDGQQFPAHTLILASRSPVFAAMFKHNMREQQEKRVTIEDLDSEAVKSLLDFMYTDRVPGITQLETTSVTSLLSAAHKYNMPRLKTLCEEEMAAKLDVQNAAEFLYTADLYDAAQLRTAAMHFTVIHMADVKRTDRWIYLHAESPHLVDEIIDELADLMRKLILCNSHRV